MIPHKTKKKITVCKKNPPDVGQPSFAIVKNLPRNDCVNLYVSGFAIKKNIRVE